MKRPKEDNYAEHGVMNTIFYLEDLEKYCDWVESEIESFICNDCEKQLTGDIANKNELLLCMKCANIRMS